MKTRHGTLTAGLAIGLSVLGSSAGCATYWQASDLEEKVDQLLKNTQRETMREIFGEQSQAITDKMDTLNEEQKTKVDELLTEYQSGKQSIDDVRSSVIGVMGGPDRVVSSSGGIWVRDEEGKKIMTVSRNSKLRNCERVAPDQLPEAIASNKGLAEYSWGRGEVKGKTVIFPWELTMSSFAKEIVENTARRTAQEVIKMAGDKGWARPVYIQVVTEPKSNVTINHPGVENEVFVTGEGQGAQPGTPPAEPEAKPNE